MKCITGTFNGTGAAVYIGIGFKPDMVIVRCPTDGAGPSLTWSKNDRVAAQSEGLLDTNGATALAPKAYGAGIRPYEGGVLLTAAMQTSTGYGEGVYLVRDAKDYRYGTNAMPGPNGGSGDAVASTIDTWTIGVLANRTGNFNEDVTGTYIGAGSKIVIQANSGKESIVEAYIEALTAGQGEAANEVTLSRQIGSGAVRFISGKYDYAPQTIGQITLPGFVVNMTTVINVNNEVQEFQAFLFDD